jgi:hypothetical protein
VSDGDGQDDKKRYARLELKMGDDVHVVLEGDPDFVMSAYQKVQENVANAMVTNAPVSSTEGPPVGAAESARAEGEEVTQKLSQARDLVWVYRCENEMRTVYCTKRTRWKDTTFVKAYGLGGVEKIYVEDERILRALRRGALTLWRELEPEGQRRIQEAADLADANRAKS